MKPVIGITPSHDNDLSGFYLKEKYTEAVQRAGGIPLLLPLITEDETIERYLDIIDGLLLSGGIDPDPLIWDEEPLPGMGQIDPGRDKFEIEILQRCYEQDIAVFGICRGFQVMNIAFGGSLIQDLASSKKEHLKHSQDAPRWYPTHFVELEKNTEISTIFSKKKIKVNSFHHQALVQENLADGFRATARSSDGIIEAIVRKDSSFMVGVQWHPECMWEKDNRFLGIFQRFVEAAADV